MSKESDWKLFSEKYNEWKERYVAARLEEYKALLADSDNSVDTFFALKDRIDNDLRSPVFRLPGRISRSDMYLNITALINHGIITPDDLSEFSDEVREMAQLVTPNEE